MSIASFLQGLYGRTPPIDPTLWHRWEPFMPVRLVEGGWSHGTGHVWRRKTAAGWEYRQDDETLDDYLDKQI